MDAWLEERVNSELQKPHYTGPQLAELRGKQRTSEFYTREHVARLIRYEARTPWGRDRHQQKVLCSAVHPPGCTTCKTCHFCRHKTMEPKTYCRCAEWRGPMVGGRNRGYWCGPCLEMRLGENIDEAMSNEDWKCPVCRNLCNCSSVNCIRAKSGLEVTNQLWHEADQLGYKSVAHYLVLTHVKENAEAMPMLNLPSGRSRRPLEWAADVADGAASSGRGSKGRAAGGRRGTELRSKMTAVARRAGEQVSLEFLPPESIHFQAPGCKRAVEEMNRLRATFEAADELEEEEEGEGDRLGALCRWSAAPAWASSSLATSAAQPWESNQARPQDAGGPYGTALNGEASAFAVQQLDSAGDGSGAAPSSHPGLPSLGSHSGEPRPGGGAGGTQSSTHAREATAIASHRANEHAAPSHHHQQEQHHRKRPRLNPGVESAGLVGGMGAGQGGGEVVQHQRSLDDGLMARERDDAAGVVRRSDNEAVPSTSARVPLGPQPPTAARREGFFWERLEVVCMWMEPGEGYHHAIASLGMSPQEMMEMVERELLRYFPSAPVAIASGRSPPAAQDCGRVQMSTHSDLRACTQILLRLAQLLPEDQVEPHVVRRLFGYEPFLDFSASDGVARAVLLDSAVQLLWRLQGTASFAAAARHFLTFISTLAAELEAATPLLREVTAYCGMTHIQEAEIAHLRLPAIAMSSYPAADERVMRLEGLLEADGRLLTLVLKHILAHCASGYQEGENVFVDETLARLLDPACAAITPDHRSLVLMIVMALVEAQGARLATRESAGEQIATSVAQSISRLESIFRRQLDALVAIETPARAEAVAGTTSDATAVPTYSSSFDVSPAQRAAVAGLGGQATMVLGRLMGLQCAAGQTSWEALETAACAPCPSNGFWEHSRPVHRNTALKLLAFALQSLSASPSTAGGLTIRLSLLRHYIRAVIERPNPNGATRLFVRMVNAQPWVGAALRDCGAFSWDLSARSGSVGRLMREYAEYIPSLMDGLLQFLSAREAEVVVEAVDADAGLEDCCRWVAATAPVLMCTVQMVGPLKLHSHSIGTGGRGAARWQQGAAQSRESLLTGILDHVTLWMVPSAQLLQRKFGQRHPAEGDEPAHARVRADARDQLKTTVLGQMAAVMDALQAVGAPSAFATPWRPSSDTLLRLALVAFRAGLETASGEAAAGPVDEAVFETLADAISPGPGDEPLSQRCQDRRRLAHFFLSACVADFLESSRYSLAYCTTTAVNALNFAAKFFGQPFLRSGSATANGQEATSEALRQLFPPLALPLLIALAPPGDTYQGQPSLSVVSKIYAFLEEMIATHPSLLVSPPTPGSEEERVMGVPLQSGPLQKAQTVEEPRFRATMQVFLATVLQSVAALVTTSLGAPLQEGNSLHPLSDNAQWKLQKLLGQGRHLAEGFLSEVAPPRGLQRVPRDRSPPIYPSGFAGVVARRGMALIASLAAAGPQGEAWVALVLPIIRRPLVYAAGVAHPLRAAYSDVLAVLPPHVAGPMALPMPLPPRQPAVQYHHTPPVEPQQQQQQQQREAPAMRAPPARNGFLTDRSNTLTDDGNDARLGIPQKTEVQLSQTPAASQQSTFSQSTQPVNPVRHAQVDGRAVVALGELGGRVNETVAVQAVVARRHPTAGVAHHGDLAYTKVFLRDDSTGGEVAVNCANAVAKAVAAALDAAPAGEPLILYLSDVEVKLKQQSAAAGALMLSAKRAGASVMVNAANPHSVSLRRWWLIANQRLRHQPSAPIPAGRSSAPPTTTSPAERPPPNRGGGSYSIFRSGATRETITFPDTMMKPSLPLSGRKQPPAYGDGGSRPEKVGRDAPSTAAVSLGKLQAMGFSEAASLKALASTEGNLEQAISKLLSRR